MRLTNPIRGAIRGATHTPESHVRTYGRTNEELPQPPEERSPQPTRTKRGAIEGGER